jgi:hypothetical protein
MTDINKKLCQHLGICWHEYPLTGRCACIKCGYSGSDVNPDFTRDPLALLRLMEKREDGNLFFANLMYGVDNVEEIDDDGLIDREYLVNQTGKFANAVLEWFKGRRGE